MGLKCFGTVFLDGWGQSDLQRPLKGFGLSTHGAGPGTLYGPRLRTCAVDQYPCLSGYTMKADCTTAFWT